MDDLIAITLLNDFIFCPISIYFHKLYADVEQFVYTGEKQLNGLQAHKSIDKTSFYDKRNVLKGVDVYSQEYGLIGKIDILDLDSMTLIERKKNIKKVYDGYVLQLYGQYFALTEMGYTIERLVLHSMDDNKNYDVPLPQNSNYYSKLFINVLNSLKTMDISEYQQTNIEKCLNCIYFEICDRGITND
ncbi:MAG: type V CRISPR-associated protein Cas4 [Clostridia bacterium]|nr:type V CRISPR-associated protein Cas4 [Clostridia bacterium]